MDDIKAKLYEEVEAQIGVSLDELRRNHAFAYAVSTTRSFWYGNEPGFDEELKATVEDWYRDNS
jgi:hypothetical protein